MPRDAGSRGRVRSLLARAESVLLQGIRTRAPLARLTRALTNFLERDMISYRGATLPPPYLRSCGDVFRDDAFYLESAVREARRLVTAFGLGPESRLLDLGCGAGRLPIGILQELGELGRYCGVDVNPQAIRWCRDHLAREHPRFEFLHLDVRNPRYNPTGRALSTGFRLPYPDRHFDIVYAYSLFSHLVRDDAEVYLRESRRILAPGGAVFLTAFLEEGVPEVSVNPAGYRREWEGALHCVRYEAGFFGDMLLRHGFQIERFDHGKETDGQSALYLSLVEDP